MESWGYLSGLLRAEKVHTLTNLQFASLADTTDSEHLLKALEDTVYGELFQGKALKEFTEVVDNYYQQKFLQIKDISPCPIMLNIHQVKADLNNLKLCYKAKLSGRQISWENLSEKGTITPERMFAIVENELWNELPPIIARSLVILGEQSKENLRQIDFLLDKAYYTYRIEILTQANIHETLIYSNLLDFYKKEIDCENIKNIFRAKTMHLEKDQVAEIMIDGGHISAKYFVDNANVSSEDIADLVRNSLYGEYFEGAITQWISTGSCTLLEKQIDEYLLNISSDFAYASAGPEVIEETLRSLQIEIKNLKLIIIGKLNNMSAEEIKERVRNVRV